MAKIRNILVTIGAGALAVACAPASDGSASGNPALGVWVETDDNQPDYLVLEQSGRAMRMTRHGYSFVDGSPEVTEAPVRTEGGVMSVGEMGPYVAMDVLYKAEDDMLVLGGVQRFVRATEAQTEALQSR